MPTNTVLLLDRNDAQPGSFALLRPRILRPSDDIQKAFDDGQHAQWIVPTAGALDRLVRLHGVRRSDQRVLVLAPVDGVRLDTLRALFDQVVCRREGDHFLRFRQIALVLARANAEEYFIGGFVNHADHLLVLYRGDLSSLVVPLYWFYNPNIPYKADPTQFELVDWGLAVRLGDFEASGTSVVREFDPAAWLRLDRRREDAATQAVAAEPQHGPAGCSERCDNED